MAVPSVSIVIPTYNRATLIVRALLSVLAQVEAGDEVIIIDDGSTDNTREVLAPYMDRIRYIRTANAGCGAARNRGIREAHNPLVAFLDSDDEWLPKKLALQRSLMQHRKDIVYCFSNFAVQHTSGKLDHRYLRNWGSETRSWDEIFGPGKFFSTIAPLPPGVNDFSVHIGDLYFDGMRSCYVPTFTVMIRRDMAGDALHFAEDLPILEDWECFSRLARVGQAAYLDCETAIQHGHSGPRLTNANQLQRITSHLTLLSRVYGADPAFLEKNGQTYQKVVDELKCKHIRALLRNRNFVAARAEIRSMGKCPWRYRAAACLPLSLLDKVLGISRLLKNTPKRS